MSVNLPTFGPLDAAAGVAYDVLVALTHALAPIDGGAATVLAIVLFTAGVRLLLVPLSRRQVRAQRAQAGLAPRLRDLQREHRNDPARLRTELTALYQGTGTSPFASLLPALLQSPAFLVLYTVFTHPAIGGRPNLLLSGDLSGVPLAAHGLAAGWPLLALVAGLALVATVNAVRARRGGAPAWLMALPYLSLIPAAIMPLAAGFYLLTTTTWSAAETRLLRPTHNAPITLTARRRRRRAESA
jgi:YidC/Oxa1 family membrane protein insertase